MSKLIKKVAPYYPEMAKRDGLTGRVELEVLVNEHGAVEELRLKRGHRSLVPSAVIAVSQWRYTPTLIDSEPRAVTASVTVNFALRY